MRVVVYVKNLCTTKSWCYVDINVLCTCRKETQLNKLYLYLEKCKTAIKISIHQQDVNNQYTESLPTQHELYASAC
jgi:hypothetical protein